MAKASQAAARSAVYECPSIFSPEEAEMEHGGLHSPIGRV